jgi:hypothetical protein
MKIVTCSWSVCSILAAIALLEFLDFLLDETIKIVTCDWPAPSVLAALVSRENLESRLETPLFFRLFLLGELACSGIHPPDQMV